MSMTSSEGASALVAALRCKSAECSCRRAELGRGHVHCPAHDDEHPSLAVDVKDKGAVVFCRAGCSQDAVLDALRKRGLWGRNGSRADGASAPPRPRGKVRITRFEVRDVDGSIRAIHQRRDFEDGSKECPWLHPDGRTSRKGEIDPSALPLYGAETLRDAPPDATPIVLEGERKTDALRKLGFVVVGSVTGAGGTPNLDALRPLARFRRVFLWGDNDAPGRAHMERIGRALVALGVEVRFIAWLDAPPKGDAADLLARGGTADDVRRLLDAATSTPPEATSEPHETSTAPNPDPTGGIITAPDLLALELPEPRWAIPGILPEGVSILAGRPKLGKSWLALAVAIAVGAGGRALGKIDVKAGSVLYIALEDTKRRLQDRLRKLCPKGAPARLHLVTTWPRLHEGGAERLRAWIDAHPDARLIVIDTLERIRRSRTANGNLYGEDTQAIADVQALAAQRGIAIVLIHHVRKGEAEDPLEMVSGSFGLTGAADAVIVLSRGRGQADAILSVTGRDVEEAEHALRWDPAASVPWTLIGDAGEVQRSAERRSVLSALGQAGRPMWPKEIAALLGRHESTVRGLLSRMLAAGELSRDARGRYSPNPPSTPPTRSTRSTPSTASTAERPVPPVDSAPEGHQQRRVSGGARGSVGNVDPVDRVEGVEWEDEEL